jgi:hypothetical protein
MEYTNRKGHRYFVFEGKTKTGKPKYFASRRATSDKAVRLDKLPIGAKSGWISVTLPPFRPC